MNHTRDQLIELFQNLPDDVRESFLSVNTSKILAAIVAKHKLHVDQAGVLSEQVGLLMLGAAKPQDFLLGVKNSLNLPIETAGEIVKEINDKIFFPVRQSLKAIHQIKDKVVRPEEVPQIEHFSPTGNVSEKTIPQAESPLPTPGNNAIIINKPVPETKTATLEAPPPTTTPKTAAESFEERMGKMFRLPKEEVEIIAPGPTPTATPSDQPASPVVDPYRELLN